MAMIKEALTFAISLSLTASIKCLCLWKNCVLMLYPMTSIPMEREFTIGFSSTLKASTTTKKISKKKRKNKKLKNKWKKWNFIVIKITNYCMLLCCRSITMEVSIVAMFVELAKMFLLELNAADNVIMICVRAVLHQMGWFRKLKKKINSKN